MHQPKRPFTTELLEARFLLTSATNAAIEKFNLSPAVFVENDGQWTDESVRFVHQGKGASIAMTDRGPVFELYRDVTPVDSVVDDRFDGRFDSRFDEPIERSIESTRFSVSFNNSNITKPIGHDRSTSTFNYNVGTPDLHRSNVPGFEKIVYPSLYDGIDLHTWGQRDSLKYEFHVDPNIDYRQIKIQYEGVEDLWIDDRGRLHAELGNGFGEVIDDSPVIWQLVLGKRVDVAGKFKLLDGDAGGDAYTFELTGKFDPMLPLVIDPDLAWSSYLGGSNLDQGWGISADISNNVWVTGETWSSGWTLDGFDTIFNGGSTDGFVAKINADSTLAWTTYLGGNSADAGWDISTDLTGNAWVTGETSSSGWMDGGFDTSYGGMHDGFVVKVNADGSLAWTSYIGGSNSDRGQAISVDANSDCWITGQTNSPGWTVDGFDTSHNGGGDIFVVKINADGLLAWSTYLGGNNGDSGWGISTDADGNAWVTGSTGSSGWVVGGFDTTKNGLDDAFIVKINTNGSPAWSSYLGGSLFDRGFNISVDINGNAWMTGETQSSDWTVDGFDTSYNGGSTDAFIAMIHADGTLAWSSFLGGSDIDYGDGISMDASGNAWLTGLTSSSNWTVGGFDTTKDEFDTMFVAKVNANGSLAWSSYLAGGGHFASVSIDNFGDAWVTGSTGLADWTVGGFDTSYNGGGDAFIAKITDQTDITIPVFETSTFNYLTTSEQTLTATFNENISASLAATDFILTNLNTTTNIPLTLQSISADGQSATFTFSATGNDLGGAILTDGHYRIRALAGQIEDAAGNALATDVDHFFDFKNCDFALADTIVDFNDLLIIAQNYGSGPGMFFSQGDANYDGFVDFNDLLAVAQRYGTGIPELRIGRFTPTTKSKAMAGELFGSESRIV